MSGNRSCASDRECKCPAATPKASDNNSQVQTQESGKEPSAAGSVTTSNADRKRKRRSPNKPSDMPRRPLSGYNMFFGRVRPGIVQEQNERAGSGDSVSFADVSREIGKRWKALPATDRARYNEWAKADKLRYQREMDHYRTKVADRVKAEHQELAARQRQSTPAQDSNAMLFANFMSPTTGEQATTLSLPEEHYPRSILGDRGDPNASLWQEPPMQQRHACSESYPPQHLHNSNLQFHHLSNDTTAAAPPPPGQDVIGHHATSQFSAATVDQTERPPAANALESMIRASYASQATSPNLLLHGNYTNPTQTPGQQQERVLNPVSAVASHGMPSIPSLNTQIQQLKAPPERRYAGGTFGHDSPFASVVPSLGITQWRGNDIGDAGVSSNLWEQLSQQQPQPRVPDNVMNDAMQWQLQDSCNEQTNNANICQSFAMSDEAIQFDSKQGTTEGRAFAADDNESFGGRALDTFYNANGASRDMQQKPTVEQMFQGHPSGLDHGNWSFPLGPAMPILHDQTSFFTQTMSNPTRPVRGKDPAKQPAPHADTPRQGSGTPGTRTRQDQGEGVATLTTEDDRPADVPTTQLVRNQSNSGERTVSGDRDGEQPHLNFYYSVANYFEQMLQPECQNDSNMDDEMNS